MNQKQKYFIDPRWEIAALQLLPFKVKNIQKNSNNNNTNNKHFVEGALQSSLHWLLSVHGAELLTQSGQKNWATVCAKLLKNCRKCVGVKLAQQENCGC